MVHLTHMLVVSMLVVSMVHLSHILMETYEKGMARAISMQIATQQRFAGPSSQSPANEGGMLG